MNPITLTIPGNPVAQKRHRDGRNGRKYDPSAGDKQRIRKCMLIQIMQMGLERTELLSAEVLGVDLIIHMPKPGSWSQRRLKEAEGKYHTKKPDLDNLRKIIYDAGNGLLWRDDSIIAKETGIKIYSEQPRIELTITRI